MKVSARTQRSLSPLFLLLLSCFVWLACLQVASGDFLCEGEKCWGFYEDAPAEDGSAEPVTPKKQVIVVPKNDKHLRDSRRNLFTHIFDVNMWGSDETVSGGGSTLDFTRDTRKFLVKMFQDLEVRSVLDLGCGDMNWMDDVITRSPTVQSYLGVDLVLEMIEENRKKFASDPRRKFVAADMTSLKSDGHFDVVICRDTLHNIPFHDIYWTLKRVAQMDATWFIANSHFGREGENRNVDFGHWFPIALTAKPFNLPRPLMMSGEPRADNKNKMLCVWLVTDIRDAVQKMELEEKK